MEFLSTKIRILFTFLFFNSYFFACELGIIRASRLNKKTLGAVVFFYVEICRFSENYPNNIAEFQRRTRSNENRKQRRDE